MRNPVTFENKSIDLGSSACLSRIGALGNSSLPELLIQLDLSPYRPSRRRSIS